MRSGTRSAAVPRAPLRSPSPATRAVGDRLREHPRWRDVFGTAKITDVDVEEIAKVQKFVAAMKAEGYRSSS